MLDVMEPSSSPQTSGTTIFKECTSSLTQLIPNCRLDYSNPIYHSSLATNGSTSTHNKEGRKQSTQWQVCVCATTILVSLTVKSLYDGLPLSRGYAHTCAIWVEPLETWTREDEWLEGSYHQNRKILGVEISLDLKVHYSQEIIGVTRS